MDNLAPAVPMEKPGTDRYFSDDAEASLIGCVLINPDIYSTIDVSLSDFSIIRHRWIWHAIGQLIEGKISVDNVTLADQLEKDKKLQEIGGPAYLARLINFPSSYLNAPDYAEIIKRHAKNKKVLDLAGRLAKKADGNGQEFGDIITDLEGLQSCITPSDPWQAFTLADAYQDRPPVEYVAAGLFALPSVNIIYGSPGTLKSLLMADLAICAAAGVEWLSAASWITGNKARAYPTRQCPVMWLDFDGGRRRTDNRIGALGRARDLPIDTPIIYYSMPNPWLNATDKNSIGALILRAKELGAMLIIIDNLGVVSGGADENSAEMIQVMSLFRQLSEETGAAVILIHHPRKGNGIGGRAGDTLRGHSSIEASLDLALLVEREELADTVSIKCTKARGADVLPFSAVFTYEDDQNGDLVTAKFFGITTEDIKSNEAIKREIKVSLYGTVMNKTDLKKAVKELLPDVGLLRIGDIIDRMTKAGDIIFTSGDRTEKKYRLP